MTSYNKSIILCTLICLELSFLANAYSGGRHKYCGKQLTLTLFWLCNGTYEQMPSAAKRSREDFEDYVNSDHKISQTLDNLEQLNYLGKFSNAHRLRLRRQSDSYVLQRGIIDECCRNPCTTEVLRSYCKSSK